MATKTKTKKAAPKKRTANTAPTKDTTPTPKPRDGDELVVFAIRIKRSERDLIHKAAGPAKASRLVRGAALAVATRDVGAFRSMIAEVQPDSN